VVEEVPVHQVAGGRVNRMGCLLGADAGGGENDMEEADGRRWGDYGGVEANTIIGYYQASGGEFLTRPPVPRRAGARVGCVPS